MKKICVIIFILLCSEFLFSQISSIDKKKGYKELKIGNDYSSLDSKRLLFVKNEDNKKVYSYTGIAYFEDFFGGEVMSIYITFIANKISSIYLNIRKKFLVESVDQSILNYPLNDLKMIIGSPTSSSYNNTDSGTIGILYDL